MLRARSACPAPGWSELFVAELPEPDGWRGDTPFWQSSGGATLSAHPDTDPDEMDPVRADALKMLAAVAVCEKYRAERKSG